MRVLPEPPVVGQLVTRLPDGSIDPADYTDCGESCLASAIEGLGLPHFSAGCIRQALGLPENNGTSTAVELGELCRGIGVVAVETEYSMPELWGELMRLRRHGRYCVMLGDWITAGVGHWVLAYERDNRVVTVMGPAEAVRAQYDQSYLTARGWSSQLWIS